jgi:primosomal protein N' (replication factor Y)
MNIIHVVPIARGINKESLSYFSAQDIRLGSLVKVPLRNRTIPALVIKIEPADEMRAELRTSEFTIRKIGKVKAMPLFLPYFMKAAEDAGRYFAGSTGSVLAQVTPKVILEQAESIDSPAASELPEKEEAKDSSEIPHEPYAIQADEEERIAHYKSLIREQFARKKSVFFCLPTIQDTKRIFEMLPKGIEEYTFVLNSSLSKKEIITVWNKIVTEPHPILIITTGSFLGAPRNDIGTIILERENSSGYKSQTRPYVDIRKFAEFLALRCKAKLIFGDLLLRTETLHRAQNGEINELAPLKFRSLSTAETHVVDMKKYKTLDKPEFRIVSDELKALIETNKEFNENMFIFAARRGLSPMTVCGDCGTTVLCTRCSAPIILHRGSKENYFLCHRCGERRSAEEKCRNCGSWKLTTLGIGIELIQQVLTNMFPDLITFRMDKDSVKTHKQAAGIAQKFHDTPGSVLIGTEMALTYLEKPVENAAVAAIDSLFSIPDFRINEKIMNILLRIRSITQKAFVIQTRSRDQDLFDYAVKGNLVDFYRDEIEARKALRYPPFTTLIKLTAKGPKPKVVEDMKMIEEVFADYSPLVFPAFIESINNKSIMHALIRIEHKQWVDEKALEKLLALPPYFAVNVDPENLL